MNITVKGIKEITNNKIDVIASKSYGHRILIASALSKEDTVIRNLPAGDDIEATIECLKNMGVKIEDGTVKGDTNWTKGKVSLYCNESGSTLRFLLPVCAALLDEVEITGQESLINRPMDELLDVMKEHGVEVVRSENSISLKGRLTSGEYRIPGNVSSQYITGLMMALPLIDGESDIKLTTPLVSKGYIDITMDVLRRYNVRVVGVDDGYHIPGNQVYETPGERVVEADFSAAANFIVAGVLGEEIGVGKLNSFTYQGDRAIMELVSRFGGKAPVSSGYVFGGKKDEEIGEDSERTIDVDNTPDLMPILAVLAANTPGTTVFTNCGRLKNKESNRLNNTEDMINTLGGSAAVLGDSLIVKGTGLKGGTVSGYNDHRMVMAEAVASVCSEEPVTIIGCEAVNKSYRDYFEFFNQV